MLGGCALPGGRQSSKISGRSDAAPSYIGGKAACPPLMTGQPGQVRWKSGITFLAAPYHGCMCNTCAKTGEFTLSLGFHYTSSPYSLVSRKDQKLSFTLK